MPNVNVVIPLYNDWESLSLLLEKMETVLPTDLIPRLHLLVVNDNSSLPLEENKLKTKISLEVLHLSRNLGHQKAIAIGLAYVAKKRKEATTIVMDSDGEDQPEHIPILLEAAEKTPNTIFFAKRSKRTESPTFKLFYYIYKVVFSLATGKAINFGNYCVLPFQSLEKLVYVSEIWNNFPGGVIKSKLSFSTVLLDRGKRLAGQSKMNFTSLILHGLGAISVHIDVVSVRLLIGSCFLILLAFVGSIIISSVRIFFPELASPGWATTIVMGFIILAFQAFTVSLFLTFVVLNYRSQKLFIPVEDYETFIWKVEKIGNTLY